jgi:hypothetical protein
MSVKFKDRDLLLPSGKTIRFDYPIDETLQRDDLIVVLLRVPKSVRLNENVFGVSERSEHILWQIQPQRHISDDSPYTELYHDKGRVGAHNWDSSLYIIDPSNGTVIEKRFEK